LHENAIRPWQHRCWIFPRDPHFQAKAGRILDLYERRWQGQALRHDEFVISSDEKTSIQARLRIHPSLPTEPGKSMRVEHGYGRSSAGLGLRAVMELEKTGSGGCLPEDSVALGMAATEKQAQCGCQAIVLPDPSLYDELAASDSQGISGGRSHGVPRKELGDRDGRKAKPSLVFGGE
jgi:hypothetical protein